jgi:hypothetical protein
MFFGKPAGQWSLRESTARLVAQLLRSQGVGAAHLRTVAVRGVVRAKANRSSTKRTCRVLGPSSHHVRIGLPWTAQRSLSILRPTFL